MNNIIKNNNSQIISVSSSINLKINKGTMNNSFWYLTNTITNNCLCWGHFNDNETEDQIRKRAVRRLRDVYRRRLEQKAEHEMTLRSINSDLEVAKEIINPLNML